MSLPIADYAFLSDCHSAALVSRAGEVDWLCFPRFDSPSVFTRLLDDAAGSWRIGPAGPYESTRRYADRSLVLETTFTTPGGRAVLTDVLLVGDGERDHDLGKASPHVLTRVLRVVDGIVDIEVDFAPRPGYGAHQPRVEALGGGLAVTGADDVLVLSGPEPDTLVDGRGCWRRRLLAGSEVAFALQHARPADPRPAPLPTVQIVRRQADTLAAWQSWSDLHQSYEGPWRDLVQHSGRVLQGLTYGPTGAIVAAPTTSLPETAGGSRNWDYRYAWLRDAALTMRAQWVAACPHEAVRFVRWMVTSTGGEEQVRQRGLRVMYGVGGESELAERELPHLAGWRGSRPVRVGNGAWQQVQADVTGELLDAVGRLQEQLGELAPADAAFLVAVADEAAQRWREPDSGIWEARGDERHYLYSKLMSYVALDRALGLADRLGPAAAPRLVDWRRERDAVLAAIREHGWDERAGAYTQSFGSSTLDASALTLLISGVLPPSDPRMRATVEAVAAGLAAPDGQLYRYREPDGLPGEEGTFVLCSYWLVECWAMLGQVDRATELFERVTSYANDVGLLAEEVDVAEGELLGNFPQAFSHVGLINAAWAIAQAQDGSRGTT